MVPQDMSNKTYSANMLHITQHLTRWYVLAQAGTEAHGEVVEGSKDIGLTRLQDPSTWNPSFMPDLAESRAYSLLLELIDDHTAFVVPAERRD